MLVWATATLALAESRLPATRALLCGGLHRTLGQAGAQVACAQLMRKVASKSTPETLVIGCGFVGSHVTDALLTARKSLRVLTRSRRSYPFDQLLGPDRLLLGD